MTPEDADSVELLRSYLKGGTQERRGTLQEYMARMAAEHNIREMWFTILQSLFNAF
jgi:hypothetical protein